MKLTSAVIGLFVVGAPAAAFADEDVKLKDVPAEARKTIQKEMSKGELTDLEKERENGKVVYEAEFTLDGERIVIDVAPDGTLLSRDKD